MRSLIHCITLPAVPLKPVPPGEASWAVYMLSPAQQPGDGAGMSARQPVICQPHSAHTWAVCPEEGSLSLSHHWADSCPWAFAHALSLCLTLPQMLSAWHSPFIQFSNQQHHLSENSATHPNGKMAAPVTLCLLGLLYFLPVLLADTVIYDIVYTYLFFLPTKIETLWGPELCSLLYPQHLSKALAHSRHLTFVKGLKDTIPKAFQVQS